jgi:matrix metalloproteinase-14 (membrane-inserted)
MNNKDRNKRYGKIIEEDELRKEIVELKYFEGINIKGEMEREKDEKMSMNRCGVREKVGYERE